MLVFAAVPVLLLRTLQCLTANELPFRPRTILACRVPVARVQAWFLHVADSQDLTKEFYLGHGEPWHELEAPGVKPLIALPLPIIGHCFTSPLEPSAVLSTKSDDLWDKARPSRAVRWVCMYIYTVDLICLSSCPHFPTRVLNSPCKRQAYSLKKLRKIGFREFRV